MAQGELLDLVCGPASPLPETYQRYRLVAHLGSGGQAEVYRAVRLCGGVSSAPMTVKVFRMDPRRPLVDELRSWDKGDAALMDLNNRGINGICRRADGFYGPPPHQPGTSTADSEAVPYQIYDYLHGVNLREYITQRAGLVRGARRLNALSALRTLAGVLRALHHPQESGATPVLHMDIKPSNLMVLTNGEVRLIDFTGARYWREEEITQISYTPESGGPEAFGGVKYVGPAYDVHGFGAVAYYLVTGTYPRVDATLGGAAVHPSTPGLVPGVHHGDGAPPPWSVLRRHPMLERVPALRDHLLAPLADRPGDRPLTTDLGRWVAELGERALRVGLPEAGVDWTEPDLHEARAVGRATAPVVTAGTETSAFQRIERLERELVVLRERAGMPEPVAGESLAAQRVLSLGSAGQLADAGQPVLVGVGSEVSASGAPVSSAGWGGAQMSGWSSQGGSGPGEPISGGPASSAGAGFGAPGYGAPEYGAGGHDPNDATVVGGAPVAPNMRGRATVPSRAPVQPPTGPIMAGERPVPSLWRLPNRAELRTMKEGWEYTGFGAFIAFICWAIWAASNGSGRNLLTLFLAFITVLAVAAGVFVLARLLGRLILEHQLGRVRRSATGAHLLTGMFLIAAGIAYLGNTSWIASFVTWLKDLVAG